MGARSFSKLNASQLADRKKLTTFHPDNMSTCCAWDGDTLVLNILGTPAAKRDRIGKPKGNQLQISVKALPFRGRATDYMVTWLAEEIFDVPNSAIEVVFGRANINKQLRIHAPQKIPSVIRKVLAK